MSCLLQLMVIRYYCFLTLVIFILAYLYWARLMPSIGHYCNLCVFSVSQSEQLCLVDHKYVLLAPPTVPTTCLIGTYECGECFNARYCCIIPWCFDQKFNGDCDNVVTQVSLVNFSHLRF